MDAFDLDRFVVAQDEGGVYGQALRELRSGGKRSHWMWFVFPQLAGLGVSQTSRFFGISSLDEAVAYLTHPVLGARLREATAAVLASPHADADELLGPVDAAKLRSSMTLFAAADPDEGLFAAVLDRFFGGSPDPRTLELLGT